MIIKFRTDLNKKLRLCLETALRQRGFRQLYEVFLYGYVGIYFLMLKGAAEDVLN